MAEEERDGASENLVPPDAPALADSALSAHDTLKYHLLGPSLTKAGQDAVDQKKVGDRRDRALLSVFDVDDLTRFRKSFTMPQKAPSSSTTKNPKTRH
jgi:hypothetical protein